VDPPGADGQFTLGGASVEQAYACAAPAVTFLAKLV
jgi:hypothetical protein